MMMALDPLQQQQPSPLQLLQLQQQQLQQQQQPSAQLQQMIMAVSGFIYCCSEWSIHQPYEEQGLSPTTHAPPPHAR
jgi:hypothetical protein